MIGECASTTHFHSWSAFNGSTQAQQASQTKALPGQLMLQWRETDEHVKSQRRACRAVRRIMEKREAGNREEDRGAVC